ncbi:hypothetical protein K0U07_04060 [bacterium]|nr:hypothetical protein [bacterium]
MLPQTRSDAASLFFQEMDYRETFEVQPGMLNAIRKERKYNQRVLEIWQRWIIVISSFFVFTIQVSMSLVCSSIINEELVLKKIYFIWFLYSIPLISGVAMYIDHYYVHPNRSCLTEDPILFHLGVPKIEDQWDNERSELQGCIVGPFFGCISSCAIVSLTKGTPAYRWALIGFLIIILVTQYFKLQPHINRIEREANNKTEIQKLATSATSTTYKVMIENAQTTKDLLLPLYMIYSNPKNSMTKGQRDLAIERIQKLIHDRNQTLLRDN